MAGVKRKRMEEERGGARLFLHRHRVTDTHFAYCRMRVGALRDWKTRGGPLQTEEHATENKFFDQ